MNLVEFGYKFGPKLNVNFPPLQLGQLVSSVKDENLRICLTLNSYSIVLFDLRVSLDIYTTFKDVKSNANFCPCQLDQLVSSVKDENLRICLAFTIKLDLQVYLDIRDKLNVNLLLRDPIGRPNSLWYSS